MEILTLSHVAKYFGAKRVLRDVNFSVPEHTIFGFVGPNGAGKTTVMKMILGLLTISSGEIMVNNMPVRYGNTPTNRFVGYLPDVPEFYPYMTPSEYLRFCGEISGMTANEIKNRSSELLRLVGLEDEKRRIKGFSRGMKQRLGVAQALLNHPKLLICDEPTSALDPAGRRELLDILTAARSETTVLFSTHILSDVEQICDEIAFLHKGSIALQGTLEEIRNIKKAPSITLETEYPKDAQALRHTFPFLKLTEQNKLLLEDAKYLPKLLHNIADRNYPFVRIERQETNLEDLFMEVIRK